MTWDACFLMNIMAGIFQLESVISEHPLWSGATLFSTPWQSAGNISKTTEFTKLNYDQNCFSNCSNTVLTMAKLNVSEFHDWWRAWVYPVWGWGTRCNFKGWSSWEISAFL